ncbi:hypothetical protein LCGC14_2632920, partial [marine sediment metagenome]
IAPDDDLRLVALQAGFRVDAGAFPGGMIGPGCMCIFSCYDFPNARVDGYDVLDNKPKTQAYRAPGATQAAYACESVVDELAEKWNVIAVMAKPFSPRELLKKVDEVLSGETAAT